MLCVLHHIQWAIPNDSGSRNKTFKNRFWIFRKIEHILTVEEADFVKTMSRIVHSQGEEFRPFFEEAIGLIKEEFADEIDLKSSEQQMIFTDYAYMIAKALQSQNNGKVEEEIMTLKSSLYLEQMLKSKEK